MRGISPTAQDRMLGKKPRMIPVARLQEIAAEVRQDKLTKLEQELAAAKAEADKYRELLDFTHPQAFKPQKLAQLVAIQYGYKLSDLRGASRAQGIVIARHHAIWLIKNTFKYLSLPAIGRMFGGRDHTTILHAIKAHERRVDMGLTLPNPDLSWIDAA
jgi:chromosomal replication initiation ATPase DnaA